MADIFHLLPIKATRNSVFDAVSTPTGLNQWWTQEASGSPSLGAEYKLQFGPDYVWQGTVTKYSLDSEFEIEMTKADSDWNGTQVGFQIESDNNNTMLQFYHLGWPSPNQHYKTSCYCWAMYLRVLKRFLEFGTVVAYVDRLDV